MSQAIGAQTAGAREYVFENAGRSAQARYHELSRVYDGNKTPRIEQRDIGRGCSCLEIGGGGGSIASRLARVGVTGRVLATDLDPRFLQSLAYENLEVYRHDIRTGGLPQEELDLAHARLVLIHSSLGGARKSNPPRTGHPTHNQRGFPRLGKNELPPHCEIPLVRPAERNGV
jgi:hypothetical protein